MNCTGKYLKVWKVKETPGGFKRFDLGDSQKDKEGKYKNWTWFDVLPVGSAKSIPVSEGDVIEVKNGMVYQEKYQDKWYTKVIIFDFEVMQTGAPKKQEEAVKKVFQSEADFDDDIPF